jgi:hypothetical protein
MWIEFLKFEKRKEMSTVELRKRLIDKIQKTEDDQLLEEVYRLLDMEVEELDIYMLSDAQMAAIELSRQQIKEGKYLTDEQANQEIDEWLEK